MEESLKTVSVSKATRQRRARRRAGLWLMAAMLLTILLAPLSGYLLTDRAVAQTGTEAAPAAEQQTNQR